MWVRQRTDLAVATEDYQPHLFRVALPGTGIRKGNAHEPHRLHCRLRRHRHLCLGLFRPSVDLHAGARGALDRLPSNVRDIPTSGRERG